MSDYADIDREFQAYQDRIADLEARIEALEAALRKRDEETKRFENGVNWQMEADRANRLHATAAARIEALEFEVEHERYNVEKTAQEAAKRIKALEAALREIARFPCTNKNRAAQQILLIAKGALEQSK